MPEDWRAWFGRADVYKQLRDFPGAAEARRRAGALNGELDAVRAFTDVTTEAGFKNAETTAARARLDLVAAGRTNGYVPPLYIAQLYAQIGDREQALDWLEKAFKEGGHVGLMLLKVNPVWKPLSSEKRFADVVLRLRIP